MPVRKSIAVALIGLSSNPAATLDTPGFADALDAMSAYLGHTGIGTIVAGAISIVAIVVMLTLFSRYYERQVQRVSVSRSSQRQSRRFKQRARVLGFDAIEIRNLEKIAAKLLPQRPEAMLAEKTARQCLVRYIKARFGRQEKQIEMLRRVLGKL